MIDGDIRALRLSADDRRAIAETDGGLWHFAANTNLRAGTGQFADDIWRQRLGTAALLELLGRSDRPGSFFLLSTAYVCGAGIGVAFEEGNRFYGATRNSYEGYHRELLRCCDENELRCSP